jgi:hypothetical protein
MVSFYFYLDYTHEAYSRKLPMKADFIQHSWPDRIQAVFIS